MIKLLIKDIRIQLADRDIIQSFTLSAESSDVVFISGDNGSGKSTLLKAVARYLPIQEGFISLSGRNSMDYSITEWHSSVHYLPQHNPLAFPVKVKDLLVMAFYREKKWYENYSSNHYVKVEELAEQFSIHHLLQRNAKELSGGELQLCWLVQSFLGSPQVLLLDEPTQYLDAKNRTVFFAILKEQIERNPFICLCATHDILFRKEEFGRVIDLNG